MIDLGPQIRDAFANGRIPHRIAKNLPTDDCDTEDATWFSGKDWKDITRDDWETHPGAFSAFEPEAFIYFLPSILQTSQGDAFNRTQAADSLLRILDRSPVVEHWDSFMCRRLLGLTSEQYDVIQAWLLSFSGTDDEETLTRSYETVELLKQETKRLRKLTGVNDPKKIDQK